jgi:hypothetical protein
LSTSSLEIIPTSPILGSVSLFIAMSVGCRPKIKPYLVQTI